MAWQFESEAGYAIAVPLREVFAMGPYGAGGGAPPPGGGGMQDGGARGGVPCTTMERGWCKAGRYALSAACTSVPRLPEGCDA